VSTRDGKKANRAAVTPVWELRSKVNKVLKNPSAVLRRAAMWMSSHRGYADGTVESLDAFVVSASLLVGFGDRFTNSDSKASW
jgi:hypothetical protein